MKTAAQSRASVRHARALRNLDQVMFDAISWPGFSDRNKANAIIDAVTRSDLPHNEIMRISNQLGRLADERERLARNG